MKKTGNTQQQKSKSVKKVQKDNTTKPVKKEVKEVKKDKPKETKDKKPKEEKKKNKKEKIHIMSLDEIEAMFEKKDDTYNKFMEEAKRGKMKAMTLKLICQ